MGNCDESAGYEGMPLRQKGERFLFINPGDTPCGAGEI